jgi:long-chain fatty acid transport protein
MSLRRPRASVALGVCLAAVLPARAFAGGLARPNIISPRAVGLGGAFTAVADDVSALHYNPAGLALQPMGGVFLGVEAVRAPRRYTPITLAEDDATGMVVSTRGEDQIPNDPPLGAYLLPTLGFATRLPFRGVPSRLALGIGVWNTFGGVVAYEPTGNKALDATTSVLYEAVPGLAYEINDLLAIGVAFRLGLGYLSVEATNDPADGDFQAWGIGAGATVGMMLTPTSRVQVGLTYRSAVSVRTRGEGQLFLVSDKSKPPEDINVSHTQEWPQSASVGVAVEVTRRLLVSSQIDWTDWSRLDELKFVFNKGVTRAPEPMDFQDSVALHLGAQFDVSSRLTSRVGLTYDTNAVPDRTITRTTLDGNKLGVATGASLQLAYNVRLDAAFEYVFGSVRTVEDNHLVYQRGMFGSRANRAPGEHEGDIYTLELGVVLEY